MMLASSFSSPHCASYFNRLCTSTPLSSNRLITRYGQKQRWVISAEEETKSTENSQEADEVPIWVRREKMRELQAESQSPFELPFFVSLILSAVIAIAAVGSIFEFLNRNPVFGVIQPDSPFWLPVLAFFTFTGLPVSGYFFFAAVTSANKLADQMDQVDKA